MIFGVVVYAIMCSRLVWAFHNRFDGFGVLGSNAYVLILVILLFTVPIRVATPASSSVLGTAAPTVEDVPDLVEIDRRVTAAFDAKDAGLSVDESLEGERPLVGAQKP